MALVVYAESLIRWPGYHHGLSDGIKHESGNITVPCHYSHLFELNECIGNACRLGRTFTIIEIQGLGTRTGR